MSRNKARPRKHQGKVASNAGQRVQDSVGHLVQDLIDFEDFRDTVLPAIRRDISAGLTAKQLREKYASLVQARLLTEALSGDSKTAITAAKDITDRQEGKATEKKEVMHKFDKMTDEELDAVLKSEQEDMADMETRFEQ